MATHATIANLGEWHGRHPVGVVTHIKSAAGPFLPRLLAAGGGAVLLVTVNLTAESPAPGEIDGEPILRQYLAIDEVLEVVDQEVGHDLIRRYRGERDRARSEASGYTADGMFGEQPTPHHADGDGTVLTPREVADVRGAADALAGAPPSIEEAQAWWDEARPFIDDNDEPIPYVEVPQDEIAGWLATQLGHVVDYVDVLEHHGLADDEEPSVDVERAIKARRGELAALAAAIRAEVDDAKAAFDAAGTPLEAGLGVAQVRALLAAAERADVARWFEVEDSARKPRKRVLDALRDRLQTCADAEEQAPAAAAEAPVGPVDTEVVIDAGSPLPPLPGEDLFDDGPEAA